MRHMHEKLSLLEERTAPAKEEVQNPVDVPGMFGGGLMMGEQLMLTNTPYGKMNSFGIWGIF